MAISISKKNAKPRRLTPDLSQGALSGGHASPGTGVAMNSRGGRRPPRVTTKPETPVPRGAMERSLRLMEYLAELSAPVSLAAVAQGTQMEANTVHRLLERLVAAGHVRKCHESKRYAISARYLFPMSLHHPLNRIRVEAREQLRLLRDTFDESVCLILFIGMERVIIDYVPGRESLSPLYRTCLTTPLHASASGLIFLSGLSAEQRVNILGEEPLAAVTGHTVTTYSALNQVLDRLQRDGFVAAEQSTFVGVTAIAAAVYSSQRVIGCLAFTGSAHGMSEARIAVLGEALKDSAALVSLGAPSLRSVADFIGDFPCGV